MGNGQRLYTPSLIMTPQVGQGPGNVTVSVYAGNPNGVISGIAGDVIFQGASANIWRCTGTTTWVLVGSSAGGSLTVFTYRQGATTNTDIGLYGDWSECHAAAAVVAAAGQLATIIMDDQITTPLTIEAGTYDLENITLVGFAAYGTNSGVQVLTPVTIGTGVIFDNWATGMAFCAVTFTGTSAPLASYAKTGFTRTGEQSTWEVTGSQPIWNLSGSFNLSLIADPYTTFLNGGGGNDEIINVGTGGTVIIRASSKFTVASNTLGGAGNYNIDVNGLQSSISATQSTASGTVTITAGTPYTPADAADWANPDPTTVSQALDRMAALLFTLNGNAAIPV